MKQLKVIFFFFFTKQNKQTNKHIHSFLFIYIVSKKPSKRPAAPQTRRPRPFIKGLCLVFIFIHVCCFFHSFLFFLFFLIRTCSKSFETANRRTRRWRRWCFSFPFKVKRKTNIFIHVFYSFIHFFFLFL